jgi:hypothetical protein
MHRTNEIMTPEAWASIANFGPLILTGLVLWLLS